MRWSPGGRSQDLEDRRGAGGGGFGGFGGGGLRLGLGGTVILLILSVIFRQDFFALLGGGGGGGATGALPVETAPTAPVEAGPEEERLVQFVSFVLDDAQGTWTELFRQAGQPYRRAKLVLFRNAVRSACGGASSASGPFYCPGDNRVYIDLAFYDELARRFGAPGDFAQAYVLAHEIGHHVQNLLGTERQVRAAQERQPALANRLSVAMELQADCYAGLWAHSTARRDLLEAGDLDEGLAAASAVGDDRLQQQAGGTVQPESFTHGTSAERARWFRQGYESGAIERCDTFAELR